MSEPDIIDMGPRPGRERTFMQVLYAMHTVAWITLGTLAVIAVVVNHIRAADEPDLFLRAHHQYMIRTFWWTVLWVVLTSPLYLLFILPGAAAHALVGLWYLYRCLRGWLRFNEYRLP